MKHIWKTRRCGGHPADVDSYELVTYCEACGVEQDDDNSGADCADDDVPTDEVEVL